MLPRHKGRWDVLGSVEEEGIKVILKCSPKSWAALVLMESGKSRVGEFECSGGNAVPIWYGEGTWKWVGSMMVITSTIILEQCFWMFRVHQNPQRAW